MRSPLYISLVKECEELEEKMMTRYTENILRGEAVEHRGMREKSKKNDKQIQFSQCVQKSPSLLKWRKTLAGANCGTPVSVLEKSIQLSCRN